MPTLLDSAAKFTSSPQFKSTAMFAATAALSFYGGPYAAVAARSAFPYAYGLAFGAVPSKLSLAYWVTYLPLREHACQAAFNYGPTFCTQATSTAYAVRQYLNSSDSNEQNQESENNTNCESKPRNKLNTI